MELRNLAAFVEVVRQGGFSVAANALCRSQPAVSRTIKQLEDEIGAVLMERTSGGVHLTPVGRVVFNRARTILAECEALMRDVDDLVGTRKRVLRLGLPVMGGSLLFARHYAEFCARNPQVEIRLIERDTADLPRAVLNGEADVVFAIEPIPQDFESVAACEEPAVAILWPDHPLAHRTGLTIPDIANWPIIMPAPSTAAYRMITEAFARHGITPRIATYSSQLPFMVALSAQKFGVTILPRLMHAGDEAYRTVRAVPLHEEGIRWKGCFIWSRDVPLSSAARDWVEMAAGENPVRPLGAS
jgi:DNA-binding transcriptional LysR family regulator